MAPLYTVGEEEGAKKQGKHRHKTGENPVVAPHQEEYSFFIFFYAEVENV
jgi:hypothetical protein